MKSIFQFLIKPKAVWPGACKKNDKNGNSKTNKLQEKCNDIPVHFKPTILSLEDYFGGSVSPFLGFYLTYFWEMIFPVYRTHVTTWTVPQPKFVCFRARAGSPPSCPRPRRPSSSLTRAGFDSPRVWTSTAPLSSMWVFFNPILNRKDENHKKEYLRWPILETGAV